LRVTVRDVGKLFGKGWGEFGCDAAVWAEESQIFAAGLEAEIGVQLRAGNRAIFPGREDDEESLGRQIGGGKVPWVLMSRAVSKGPAGEIHVGGLSIVEFDPIAEFVVLIGERVFVVRHELADDHLCRGGYREQREESNEEE